MTTDKWLARYAKLARFIADEWSKDPTTKVGAVLVGINRRHIALGYNGFPPGVGDTWDRLVDRGIKHRLTQHAERNVLDNAWFDTRGSLLVTTMFPCSECVKSMVSRGVLMVYTPRPVTWEPWKSDADLSTMLMKEAGIHVKYHDVETGRPEEVGDRPVVQSRELSGPDR